MTISPLNAAVAAGVVLLIYNLAPLALGTDGLVARVPDDAFYYLVLCKNFVAKGFWTFDGEHWASGFHILFGYLIVAIYWAFPGIGLEAIYALVVVINTMLVAAAVYLLARVNESLGIAAGNIGLVLVALSSAGLRLPGFPMEACLVIFFSAAAFYLVSPGLARKAATPLLAIAVGILGVLSRTDWGAMPFALLAGALGWMWLRDRFDRDVLKSLACLCVGALIGEAAVMLHTYLFTGGLVQRSASIKHFWASVQGYTPLPGIARVVELLGPYVIPRPIMLGILAGIAGLMAWRGRMLKLLDNVLAPGCVLVILGYWAVYALNGSVQYWYAATFFAAVAVLGSSAWALLPEGVMGPRAAVAALFMASAVYQFANPPWPWAPAMVEAGRYLRSAPEIAPVGAWNAGIISYFSGRPVINLDGLVNDDVYSAIVSGGLARYVDERNIAYLADFPAVFSEAGAAKGGYADGLLKTCSRPARTFSPHLTFENVPLTLLQVDRVCLKRPSQK